MQMSARNSLKGTVKAVEIGAVNAQVVVEITSIITKKSCESLGDLRWEKRPMPSSKRRM